MTIQEAIDKLLDAYNDNKLFHGLCRACAVGNLLDSNKWRIFFCTTVDPFPTLSNENNSGEEAEQSIYPDGGSIYSDEEKERIKELIKKSGFSMKELARIEYAFESSIVDTEEGYFYWIKPNNEKKGQYIGLCAVLDVLQDIEKERGEKLSVDFHKEKKKLTEIYYEKIGQ